MNEHNDEYDFDNIPDVNTNFKTYRQELIEMEPRIQDKETIVSNYISTMYKVISWVTKKANRNSGYVNHMSSGKMPYKTLDVMNVMYNIIDDNDYCFPDKSEELIKLTLINKYCKLIMENLDNAIRTDPNIVYDDEKDNEDPLLNCDMLTETFCLMNDLFSIGLDKVGKN